MSLYEKVPASVNFVEREKQTEKFWHDNDIFRKSMEQRKGDKTYTFYDGPPTANGKPHIGHVLTRVIKDMIPRYRTMKGYNVPRKAGWDTHGLPVELEVEKMLGLDGKDQIEKYGLDPFITKCKESVWKYKEIRKFKNTPILMLSARTEEYDKLFGFEMGVDDYVVKPFSPKEVLARINAIIKRNKSGNEPVGETVKFEGLEINFTARDVFIDGEKANLTPKEYDLLFYLVKNKNIALTRNKLLEEVWGYDFFGDDRTIDTHIKMLRNNLGPYRKFIVTLRGMGYKFQV